MSRPQSALADRVHKESSSVNRASAPASHPRFCSPPDTTEGWIIWVGFPLCFDAFVCIWIISHYTKYSPHLVCVLPEVCSDWWGLIRLAFRFADREDQDGSRCAVVVAQILHQAEEWGARRRQVQQGQLSGSGSWETDQPTGRRTGRATDRPTDRPTDWPTDRPNGSSYTFSCSRLFVTRRVLDARQILRSLSEWSGGVPTERSIHTAYVEAINSAQHFIYIEVTRSP